MIRLARRYSAVACALFALAAIPVWLHRVSGPIHDSCADPSGLGRLPAYGANYRERQGLEDGGWQHAIAIGGLLERTSGVYPFSFGFVRRADPTFFYGEIESLFFPVSLPSDRSEVRPLEVAGETLPVTHVYTDDSPGSVRFSQYFLVQGGRPVARPSVGLGIALDQLVHGTQPVGAFLISSIGPEGALEPLEQQASAWLAAAWTDYRKVCQL